MTDDGDKLRRPAYDNRLYEPESSNNGRAIAASSEHSSKAPKTAGLFDKLGTIFKRVILDDNAGGSEDYDK